MRATSPIFFVVSFFSAVSAAAYGNYLTVYSDTDSDIDGRAVLLFDIGNITIYGDNVHEHLLEWDPTPLEQHPTLLGIVPKEHAWEQYFTRNGNNTFIQSAEGTEGFTHDSDLNFYFEGEQSFGICKDDGTLYAKVPSPYCKELVNVTLHGSSGPKA